MSEREAAKGEPKVRLAYGVKLTLAYDGTDFHGWQSQPKVRTVQKTVERAVRALGLRCTRMRGCSRTDAGVHALGQVASFACDRDLPEKAWTHGLNGLLPPDVAVMGAEAVDRRSDPRNDTTGKLYRYQITVGETRDPLSRRQAWHLSSRSGRKDIPKHGRPRRVEAFLDLEAMRDAARRLEGTHDFKAFRAYDDRRENTVRTMRSVRVLPGWGGREDMLAIEVEGNAFMKNMVRILAGTLVDIGRLHLEPSRIDRMLAPEGQRKDGGQTAPAMGLTLVRIDLGRGDHPRAPKKEPTGEGALTGEVRMAGREPQEIGPETEAP